MRLSGRSLRGLLPVILILATAAQMAAQNKQQISAEDSSQLIKSAEGGDATAQYNLGSAYSYGRGVAKDDAEAVSWYRKAAEQGNVYAQYNLGEAYHNGDGVPKDDDESVLWYRKAAEQGNVEAQRRLGIAYRNGEGVQRDYGEAVRWFRKAAEQGHAGAELDLGEAYIRGQGVAADSVEGAFWYRKAVEQQYADTHQSSNSHASAAAQGGAPVEAARQTQYQVDKFAELIKKAESGDAQAEYQLGVMYDNGLGVPKDTAEAMRWWRKAAAQGNKDAQAHTAMPSALPPSQQQAAEHHCGAGMVWHSGYYGSQPGSADNYCMPDPVEQKRKEKQDEENKIAHLHLKILKAEWVTLGTTDANGYRHDKPRPIQRLVAASIESEGRSKFDIICYGTYWPEATGSNRQMQCPVLAVGTTYPMDVGGRSVERAIPNTNKRVAWQILEICNPTPDGCQQLSTLSDWEN
jgi:TPR repeat protein